MIKILQKKVFKTIPIWLLVILCIGTVFAAFTWISNQIVTYVQVTPTPITITGAFVDHPYPGIECVQTFNYTVYSGTPTGWIYITFHTQNISDVLIGQVSVLPFGGGGASGSEFPGYPIYYQPLGLVEHLFYAPPGGNPFNFGSTNGTITIKTTYNVTAPVNINTCMQVTSNPIA
jgi:hypothetical protein